MALLGSVVTKDLAADRTYAGVPAIDVTDRLGPQFAPLEDTQKAARLRDRIRRFEDRRPGFRGQLDIALTQDEVHDPSRTTFVIADRTYTKRGTAAEVVFLKEHGNVKFIPVGEPDPW